MTTTPIRMEFQDGCAVEFEFPQPVHMSMSAPSPPVFTFDVGTVVIAGVDDYKGVYDVIPTAEPQSLPTKDLRMFDDVRVAAIPNNYGLITYNGSIITVS